QKRRQDQERDHGEKHGDTNRRRLDRQQSGLRNGIRGGNFGHELRSILLREVSVLLCLKFVAACASFEKHSHHEGREGHEGFGDLLIRTFVNFVLLCLTISALAQILHSVI